MKGMFAYRPIDRAVIGILAVVNVLNGLYVAGPWYLPIIPTTGQIAPMQALFHGTIAIHVFGAILLCNGLWLLWLVRRSSVSYRILTTALFTGFFLRLYSLIGVLILLSSPIPPTYISHAGGVFIIGSYWVWVKYNERLA